MVPNSQAFSQELVDQNVSAGDYVLDLTPKSGRNSRLLAARVGDEGKVLSFHADADIANEIAASLLLSGLNDRVEIFGKQIDQNFALELGHHQLALAMIDYSRDGGFNDDATSPLLQDCQIVMNHLKKQGLLIMKSNQAEPELNQFFDTLFEEDYQHAYYLSNGIHTYLLGRC
ncbi:SAM-dependent methyltransferase [Eupransor demetentiae]|uniref:tRNA A58 N-methylase Trm61 (Gcd14) n=1 Tax=Eupransor demetentiae TaxID=3109584 RepID=A0ABM9N3J9_9LACO|nr:tRNA A58 N-methylase Trm61 (Gcd14) [Lactobacillaceae bacterium LMG 33000]